MLFFVLLIHNTCNVLTLCILVEFYGQIVYLWPLGLCYKILLIDAHHVGSPPPPPPSLPFYLSE